MNKKCIIDGDALRLLKNHPPMAFEKAYNSPQYTLMNLCDHLDMESTDYCHNGNKDVDVEIIEKALKALEIIKKKSVDVGFLQYFSSVEIYNHYIIEHAWTRHTQTLTKEESDLLREELL